MIVNDTLRVQLKKKACKIKLWVVGHDFGWVTGSEVSIMLVYST